MARYDFQCTVCSKVIEIERLITDTMDRTPYCDQCLVPTVRLWQATPVHFNAKGFYSKDNRK